MKIHLKCIIVVVGCFAKKKIIIEQKGANERINLLPYHGISINPTTLMRMNDVIVETLKYLTAVCCILLLLSFSFLLCIKKEIFCSCFDVVAALFSFCFLYPVNDLFISC